MILGYHTGGLLLHDEATAIAELASLGYAAAAVRPRRGQLDPTDPGLGDWVARVRGAALRENLLLVLDSEGRFMHHPRVAAGPSLVAAGRAEAAAAYDWVCRMLEIADRLSAGWVTFAAGTPVSPLSPDGDEQTLERLATQLGRLLRVAGTGPRLTLRPAASQAIATVAQFERLLQWIGRDSGLRLAADLGEMWAGGELPVSDRLARNVEHLGCVYLCDRRVGVPGDQRFGRGDVAHGRVLQALRHLPFDGPVIARVNGFAECGLEAAAEAMERLQ